MERSKRICEIFFLRFCVSFKVWARRREQIVKYHHVRNYIQEKIYHACENYIAENVTNVWRLFICLLMYRNDFIDLQIASMARKKIEILRTWC